MADLLIVDDDLDTAEILADVLDSESHAVRIAHNGQEGLALVAVRKPDLVLLDVEMPVLSGPDMAYQLFLRDCGDEYIPIVLLSGVMELPSVAAVVGTPYFLPKPYTLEELDALMARALVERRPPVPRVDALPVWT
jgi:DNA-binding response OmpR family regulator